MTLVVQHALDNITIIANLALDSCTSIRADLNVYFNVHLDTMQTNKQINVYIVMVHAKAVMVAQAKIVLHAIYQDIIKLALKNA